MEDGASIFNPRRGQVQTVRPQDGASAA